METRLVPPRKKALFYVASLLSRIYPVGPKNAAEGVSVCQELSRHRMFVTLGKFSTARDDPEKIVREYCWASDALKDVAPGDFSLSVKPPALGFHSGYLSEIASAALRNGHGVHFDSHGHDLADPTLDALDVLLKGGISAKGRDGNWQLSLTLPSRWKRSLADAEWAIERGLRVRLVKGEFAAGRSADERDPREGFLTLVERLAGKVPELALGTHDDRLAKSAIVRAASRGPSPQLELLYGFPVARMLALSKDLAVRVGVYVPYGDILTAYAIRHVLGHPHKLLRGSPRETLAGHRSRLARIVESAGAAPRVRNVGE